MRKFDRFINAYIGPAAAVATLRDGALTTGPVFPGDELTAIFGAGGGVQAPAVQWTLNGEPAATGFVFTVPAGASDGDVVAWTAVNGGGQSVAGSVLTVGVYVEAPTLAALTFTMASPDPVPEDAAIGTLVATAQGRTAGSTLTLPVSAGGRFAIDTGTGEIRVAAALDYETATSHQVTVREAHAGASNSPRDTVLTISVADVDETPAATTITQTAAPTLATPTEGDTALSAYTNGTTGTYTADNGQTISGITHQMRSGGVDVADSYILPAGAGLAVRETVTASDGTTETFESAAVTVQEAPNDPPVAVADTATVAAGGTVQIDVLANDSDPDGDALSVIFADTDIGSVTIGSAPDYLLTFDASGLSGGETATISYTLSDGDATDLGAVTVTVEAVAPVLSNLQTSGSPVDTVTVEADKDCTVYWRLSSASGQDAATVAGGGGDASGSFATTGSGGSADLDLTSLAAGTYYLAVVAQSDGGPLSNVLEVEAVLEEVGASVAFDHADLVLSTTDQQSNYTTNPFLITSGTDRCLIAVVHGYLYASGSSPVIQMTFAGQPLAVDIIDKTVSGQKCYSAIGHLVAPPSGSGGTLTIETFAPDGVTPVNNIGMAIHLIEATGVDQANPVPTTGVAGAGDNGGVVLREPSLVTQFPGSLVVSGMAMEGAAVDPAEISVTGASMLPGSPGRTGTANFSDVTFAAARRVVSSVGTETHSYAWTSGEQAIATIAEIKAA